MALTFGLAALSFALVEKPIRSGSFPRSGVREPVLPRAVSTGSGDGPR